MSLIETKISRAIKAFSSKTTDQITSDEIAAANAVLAEEGITSVSLSITGASDPKVIELENQVTTLTKERDSWKEKANKVPASSAADPNVEKPIEGKENQEAKAFETSVDRELKALNGN